MRIFKKLKASQPLRLIVNGSNPVSLFTTAKAIRAGLGSHGAFNQAAIDALTTLEDNGWMGLCEKYGAYSLQLDRLGPC